MSCCMSMIRAEEPHPSSTRQQRALQVDTVAMSSTVAVPTFEMEPGPPRRVAGRAASFVGNFASQDWLIMGYLAALLVALAVGGGGVHDRAACAERVGGDL